MARSPDGDQPGGLDQLRRARDPSYSGGHDARDMTRRESVRVLLFARAKLIGVDRSLRCAVVDLSAAGAMLTVTGRVPAPPLRLELELGGERLELPIEIQRLSPDGGVAVAFARPHSERLHHLIAAEQRRALAQRRVNISERRVPRSFRRPPDKSGS
ncbi:MAG: PilZ domain-containing protein [Solirubrobacteraceae bacterium]